MAKGYVIHVGHYAPQEVIVAHPNKDGTPGVNVATTLKTVGSYNVINRARVWGRRVMDTGKLAKEGEVVEVTTKDYHGKIEFLPWGTPEVGAQAIDIRYLPQSNSLDVEYQDNIQKIRIDPSGRDDTGFIELASGQNKFDATKQVLFIQFLKVHPQNKNSVYKNPDPKIKGFTYYEVTDEHTDTASIKQDEASFTAGSFVMGISTKVPMLRNLMSLFIDGQVDFGDVSLLSGDLDVYKALLNFAKTKPGDFAYLVNDFKAKVSDNFEKAKSYKALDLTKDGVIAIIVNSKREVIFENVEATGELMLNWVLDHYLDEAVNQQIKHLKMVCDKLKA